MRRILSSGLVMVAGMISATPAVAPHHSAKQPAGTVRRDPRLASLQRFFDKTECPAAQLANVFLEAADDYDLDWRLLPSLSWIETTGGKQARRNNMFGWDSGRAEFSSLSAGIHQVGYRLAKSGLYRDKDLDSILATYNPSADYARRVKSVMRRISPSE